MESLRTRDNMRSNVKVEHVFVEPNGYVRRAELPIGKGYGDGTPTYWINQGWKTAEVYDADLKKAQVINDVQARLDADKAELKKESKDEKKAK